mmetsp:Transcript_13326/g.13816  ORF Transcript_13326/g.13816 Transcript_13326/m.13816 type:complete len:321 (+) Transcript_13326:100-1062(+)|eukprot:CAMPEP_0174818918 /NCGR_PEP_ID=MMETSP1107-20130205/1866_1 /TAXON_ID=36770 /ORGANISM="Paraphysomonas vestita, Strain GFlagA" /LENGTH=320 /DNA_ID=CAMNT_0016031519 /DNA_START=121 /DNA_END=1083 /DNA_ORIENTATION=+
MILDAISPDINPNRKISIHKYRKKQAANDSQLLLNRIALLQKEEERARKKVDQTKLRALDILALREENDVRTREWMEAAANEQRTREEIYRRNAEMEEQSRIVKKKQYEAVVRKKKQDVDQVRDEKLHLREEMLKMKELDVKRKQQMRTEIRIKEEEARRKREEEKRLQEQKIREYYEMKAKQEELEAIKAEKLVKRLEKKEREWIEKLRQAQQIQETAYHDLESALSRQPNSLDPFEVHNKNYNSDNQQTTPTKYNGGRNGNGNGSGNGGEYGFDGNGSGNSGDENNGKSVERSKSGSLSQRSDGEKKSRRGPRKPSSS